MILASGLAAGSLTVEALDSGVGGLEADESIPVALLATEAYHREAMTGLMIERGGAIRRAVGLRAAILSNEVESGPRPCRCASSNRCRGVYCGCW